jgi:outer membrane protein OmpA-like peptidoglycan-associated protein
LTLNAVLYPEDRYTEITLKMTPSAPDADVTAGVELSNGQSWIGVQWKRLEPAVLFGGDVNCWVLWAVTPDGVATALGELGVGADRSGTARFSTPQKNFAMIVTGEPFPLVSRPSDLVGFISQPASSKFTQNKSFKFAGFRSQSTRRDRESIAGMRYQDATPIELHQARKAIEIMDRFDAEKYAQSQARDARTALAQADDAYAGRVGKKGDVPELSRRAMTIAAQAMRESVKQIEAQRAQDAEAKRQAEIASLEAKSDSEKKARIQTEATLADVARQREQLAAEMVRVTAEKTKLEADRQQLADEVTRVTAEKTKIESDREQLKSERDALAHRLSGALSEVAQTASTARGLVVSLSSGILFDVNKSELKADAKITLAKLAGILLMMPDARIEIEGHTDATGSEETNAKLSLERAASVMEFLKSQGVGEPRMTAKGLGSSQPVAGNDTADDRAKNRRVEIVLPSGA